MCVRVCVCVCVCVRVCVCACVYVFACVDEALNGIKRNLFYTSD